MYDVFRLPDHKIYTRFNVANSCKEIESGFFVSVCELFEFYKRRNQHDIRLVRLAKVRAVSSAITYMT